MADFEKLQARYDKRLKRVRNLRKRQESKEFMTDKICDYLMKVGKQAGSDLSAVMDLMLKGNIQDKDALIKLNDEVMEVYTLSSKILGERYNYLEY